MQPDEVASWARCSEVTIETEAERLALQRDHLRRTVAFLETELARRRDELANLQDRVAAAVEAMARHRAGLN